MTWINVEGLGDAGTIEQFGELFGLHRLALEDTVNVHQRAKVEDYGEVLFIVLRMVYCAAKNGDRCGTEQLSMFLGPNWLLTFQEGQPGDSFDRVRTRLREGSGKMRTLGSDYLAYALIDAVIDNYYPVLEVYAERLDELEDLVMEPAGRRVMDRAARGEGRSARAAAGDLAAARCDGVFGPRRDRADHRQHAASTSATATTTWCRSSSWSKPIAS